MSLPVFLADDLDGDVLRLSGPEGRHAVTVKRCGVGERIKLIDGRGAWAECVVLSVEGKDVLEAAVEKRGEEPSPRPRVTVVQAIPKAERSELAVDLATQAGADRIVAWQAQRCVAKWIGPKAEKHLAKWENAALAAAKQSRRSRVPEVLGPFSTAEVVEFIAGKKALVLHEDAELNLRDVDLDCEELVLLVGPEGGIGREELEQLGAQPVKLGPEVYRTASAAMVALSAIGVLTSRW